MSDEHYWNHWSCDLCQAQRYFADVNPITRDGKGLCLDCFDHEESKAYIKANPRRLVGRVVVDSGTMAIMDALITTNDDLQQIQLACGKPINGAGVEDENRGVVLNIGEDGSYPVYAIYDEDVEPVRYIIEMFDDE